MYRIFCGDGIPVYISNSNTYVVDNPELVLELNSAGSLKFNMPPSNPSYNAVKMLRQDVYVMADDEEIFRGRIIGISSDWLNRKTVECEGELAYLNDTIQRQKAYHAASVADLFRSYVTEHNNWIYPDRRFTVGICTVTSTETSIYRFTNYQDTWTELKEDLIDNYGGYIRVRNENGVRYLDYISDFGRIAKQPIAFSKNLLDLSNVWDGIEMFTRLIPLGATLDEEQRTWRAVEGLEEYLTIRSVNGGEDYIDAPQAVKDKYGVITRIMNWDEVTEPAILKRKAQDVMDAINFEESTFEVKAIDLHLTDSSVEAFRIGDKIPVISEPHGISDTQLLLSRMDIKLDKPSESTFTIGGRRSSGLSDLVKGGVK